MTRLSKEKLPEYQRKLNKWLQAIREMPEPKEPEEGGVVWEPCAGIQSLDIPIGHVGRICKAKRLPDGKFTWKYTGIYLNKDEAKKRYPQIIFSGSAGSCPSCSKIIHKAFVADRKK